jgi:hypothetical protein
MADHALTAASDPKMEWAFRWARHFHSFMSRMSRERVEIAAAGRGIVVKG